MIFLRDPAPSVAETLIVLLPGAYMTPAHFVDAGFISALRSREKIHRQRATDVAIAHLDLATVSDGSCLHALRETLILPARRSAYRYIWLGGISLGGFLSLSYVEQYPGEIDGLCLLAPYPGNRMTTNEIEAAGGLRAWQAESNSSHRLKDPEFRVWQWLKSDPHKLPLFMAYGSQDRFVKGMTLMASAFDREQVKILPGDHDWPTWRRLWDDFLDTTFLNLI